MKHTGGRGLGRGISGDDAIEALNVMALFHLPGMNYITIPPPIQNPNWVV